MTRVVKVFILFLLASFPLFNLQAQITVDTVIFSFQPGQRPVKNVVVKNNGDTPLLVEVEPAVVNNPGGENEERVFTEDLVASPKRFSIEPKGERTVRVLLKKQLGTDEQVYRVKFVPKTKGLDPAEEQGGKRTMVRIVTGVGILIFGRPLEPKVDFSWKRSGDSISFENKGNTNVLLQEIKVCKSAEDQNCSDATGFRLYPGRTRTLNGVSGKTLRLKKEVLEEFEDLVIEP